MVEVAETTNKSPGKYSVPGLDKGLDVLELLSDRAASMSQVEIARALGKSTSEIFRTLSALEARTYIRRTEAGQYRLTLKLFELSRMHSPYEEMMRVALPIMRRLSEEIGETCHLTTLRDGEIVVLAQHESPKPLRLSVEVGSKHSPIATTSGRIILSAMTAEDRKAFLTDYTSFDELPDDVKTTFLNRVNNVVERGYEIAEGEKFVGGLDVGVLVGTEKSTVRAALIVATLRNADGPDTDRLLSAVQEAGAELTERIGLGD